MGAAQLRPRLAAASGHIAQGPPAPPRGSGVPAAPLRGPVAPRVASGTESALSKRLPAQGPGRAPLGTLLLTPLTAGTSPPGASGRETDKISQQAALYQVTRTGRPTRAGLAAVVAGDRVSHTRTGNTAPPGGPAEARSPPPAEASAATPRRAFALETIRRGVSSPHFVTVLVLTLRCPPASTASASRRDPGPAGAPRSDAADPQAQTTYPESAGREPPAGPSASTGHTLPGHPARTLTSAPPGGLTRPLMPELLATAATRPGEACSAEDAPTSWGQTEAPTGTRSGEAGFKRDCGLASQSQRGQCE